MKIRPLNDVVLVLPADPKMKTSGGIHLSKSLAGSFSKGTVLRVGPGKLLGDGTRVPMPCKIRDEVLFAPSKDNFEHDGKNCYLVRDTNILAVVTA